MFRTIGLLSIVACFSSGILAANTHCGELKFSEVDSQCSPLSVFSCDVAQGEAGDAVFRETILLKARDVVQAETMTKTYGLMKYEALDGFDRVKRRLDLSVSCSLSGELPQ